MNHLNNLATQMRSIHLKNGPLPLDLRISKLKKLKEEILRIEVDIQKALKIDLGKSDFESYATEIGFILEDISFILKNIKSWSKKRKVSTPLPLMPGKSFIYPEPFGVVLIKAPWNYPFQLSVSPLIGAIAAGNRVVLKPSEHAPETALVLERLMGSVFDREEVQVVQGGLEISQNLLHQKWDYIFFTGSTSVGKIVMKAAAEHLTPVTLELGGKSPCVVDASADLDLAAKRIVWGKFVNAGQTCVAPDYVLVHESKLKDLITKLKFQIEKFYGKNIKNSLDYPRIINERHFERLKKLIDTNKIVFGGELDENNKFISPTLISNVSNDDLIMQDEIFGPLLPIISYKKIDEVYSIIQSKSKPLAFYLFSSNQTQIEEVLRRINFGGGCINDTVIHLANPNLPFGGVGDSGVGSYHGKKSFETFTHYKSVFHQSTRVDIPVRYPPYKGKMGLLKFFMN